MKFIADDILADGDKVIIRYTMPGTHKGTFAGIAATGKVATVKGMEIFKFNSGKRVEMWDYPDLLGMMVQLGAFPNTALKK